MEITELPFNRFIGIERSSVEGAVFALAADEKFTNHLGTVHASALLALAEATSGECLVAEFRSAPLSVLPVVRRIEAKFRKPASGAIYSRLGNLGSLMGEFRATLSARGRALIAIPVDIFDMTGAHVLAATVEWFVGNT